MSIMQGLEDTIRILRARLDNQATNVEQYRNRHAAAMDELTSTEVIVTRLQECNKNHSSRIDVLTRERDERTATIRTLKDDLHGERTHNASLQRQISDDRKVINDVVGRNNDLLEANDMLDNRIELDMNPRLVNSGLAADALQQKLNDIQDVLES